MNSCLEQSANGSQRYLDVIFSHLVTRKIRFAFAKGTTEIGERGYAVSTVHRIVSRRGCVRIKRNDVRSDEEGVVRPRARWWILRKEGGSKERTRAGDKGVPRGTEKRTTVVRGYRELHNSWPSHNRAAHGCERADGMSFSFVSSRRDYFSFHSFVSCRGSSLFLSFPLSLSLFLLLLLSLLFDLLSSSVFLSPFSSHHRAQSSLLVPFTTLSFAHTVRPRLLGASRNAS